MQMILSLLFAVYSSSLSSKEKYAYTSQLATSFSFATGPKRQFTLSGPQLNIKNSKSSHNSAKRSLDTKQESQWYYVHINEDDLSILQKYVNIRPDDEIIKNTFVLYLTPNQLEKILPYSYIKLLDPADKVENLHPYNEIDSFFVKTAPNHELPSNDPLYTIIKKNQDNTYIVKVNQDGHKIAEFNDLKQKVSKKLSEIPFVKKVTTYSKPALQNHINIGYVQKNLQPFRRDSYSKLLLFDRYVHNHGLTGSGEVITIEDSMIDFRHPMFRDDEVQIEFNKDMPNHRKFLYYRWDGDMNSWLENLGKEEHGTHTAGTLAGKSVVTDSSHSMSQLFDGSAPDAKLVYAGLYDNLTGPELADIMKSHGSRVSSNSWGDSAKYVDELNYKYGVLAYENPQSIFIFAAGNYAISGTFSVIDPSGSKNVLCVSATSHPLLKNIQEFSMQSDSDDSILIFGNFATDEKDFEFSAKYLGTPENQSDFVAIHYMSDEKGGNTTHTCKQMDGKYYSVLYGDDLMEMMDFVSFCQAMQSRGRFLTTQVSDIEKVLNSGSGIKVRINANPTEVREIIKLSVASIGPGNKGIMKPDLTAPGETIISAKSYLGNETSTCKDINDGCGLVFKYGTSMSTPNVAGGAALISQYFKSGKWIEKTELDGTTLRALLINSARHPNNQKTPDTFFGHGVVDLSAVLPLESEFGLQIPRQNVAPLSVRENGHVVAKIDVKSTKVDLQITLSYLDVMLEQSSPIPLTRDLDLVVVSPNGEVFKGDDLEEGDTQHFSTNEKVIVRKEELKVGTYTVHVYGNKFLDSSLKRDEKSTQDFSVVATGDIENKYIEFAESSESPCKESDEKNPGYCKCESDKVGPICQAKVVQGTTDEMVDIELEPRSLYRIKFTSDNILDTLTYYTDYYVASNAKFWLSQTCHLMPHEYESVKNFVVYEDFAETINITQHIGRNTQELCVMIFANSDMKHAYHLQVNTSDIPATEKKLSKKTIILIVVAAILGVALLAAVTALVVIFIRLKNKDGSIALNTDNGNSSEPLHSPLLF